MTLHDNFHLKSITQNPFRILGVTANAPKREMVANVSKFKAYLKVRQSVKGVFDNIPGISHIERSVEMIASAERALELPIDQLHWSLFWFVNQTPVDKIALNHIQSGDIVKAIEVWSKVDSVSSLKNLVVAELIQQDLSQAALHADRLFSEYASPLCSMIDETLDVSKARLIRMFIEALASDNYEMLKSMHVACLKCSREKAQAISVELSACINETLAAPYINEAKAQLAKYESTPEEDISERYKLAKEMLNGKGNLRQIHDYLGTSSSEYQTLANKIVKVALDCAIDYYNDSADSDEIAFDVKNLVETATIAAMPGSPLRQRCLENYDKICEICSKLPPQSALYYHRLIKPIIESYNREESTIQNASEYVKRCYPYLMSIKSAAGECNEYYIRTCTRVAQDALHDIIHDYNKKNESLYKRLHQAAGETRRNIIRQIQEMIKTAVITLHHLRALALDPEFANDRFNPNYDTIAKEARIFNALAPCSVSVHLGRETPEDEFNRNLKKYAPDLRDENGYFSTIRNLQDCHLYRKIFPCGKFTTEVSHREEWYAYQECGTLDALERFSNRYPSTRCDIEAKREEIIFKSCRTINDYRSYLARYSRYRAEAFRCIDNLFFGMCNDRAAYVRYLTDFPHGWHRMEAMRKIDDIDYQACDTAEDYARYLGLYPGGCHEREAKARMEEEKFWALCVSKNARKLYREYVEKYPDGRYLSQAEEGSLDPVQKLKRYMSIYDGMNGLVIVIAIAIIIGIVYSLLSSN